MILERIERKSDGTLLIEKTVLPDGENSVINAYKQNGWKEKTIGGGQGITGKGAEGGRYCTGGSGFSGKGGQSTRNGAEK